MARIHEYTANVAASLALVNAIPLAMQGDAEADTLRIRVYNGRTPETVEAYNVGGYLERPDGKRVKLSGTAAGNMVELTLQAECYRVAGNYKAYIRLSKTMGEKMTLFLFGGYVESEGDGDVVSDEQILPDLDDIIAMIDEIEEATADAKKATEEVRNAMNDAGNAQLTAISNAGAAEVAKVKSEGSTQTQAVKTAGAQEQAAIENKAANALASIPEDYTQLGADVSALKDTKADAIMDTSARAVVHELHAQDGKLHVTLYGKTTETGSGDKSPDNPYTISGVDAARVHVGGENLINVPDVTITGPRIIYNDAIHLCAGTYSIGFNVNAAISTSSITFEDDTGTVASAFPTMTASGRWTGRVTLSRPARNVAIWINSSAVTVTGFMLNAGSTALPYDPYIANTITPPLLPDGAPLHGNGTVDDTVENDVPSGCDKTIVLDGSDDEGWKRGSSAVSGAYTFISGIIPDGVVLPVNNYTKCNVVMFTNWIANKTTIDDSYANPNRHKKVLRTPFITESGAGAGFGIAGSDFSAMTLDEFKAYLSANPLTVYYDSTDYTPARDLRVCRVTRNYISAKISDFAWTPEGVNSQGLRAYYAPAIGKVYANGDVECEELPTGYAQWQSATNKIYAVTDTNRLYIIIDPAHLEVQTTEGMLAAVGDALVTYRVWPEIYMTDAVEARKPDTLDSDTVTVTGSGETAVEYPHDTKHYIDSQIAAAVALALGN